MEKIDSIKDILSPQARYFFLDDEGFTEAILFTALEHNSFLIHHPKGLPLKKRSGFFIAADGKGIVRFEGSCEALKPGSQEKKLYRLDVDMDSLDLKNRREFVRHTFENPTPVLFKCNGKNVQAYISNISEGGLRMSVDEKLPTQVVYHFEMTLPDTQEQKSFIFQTDGMVVYCEPETDPGAFIAGVTFIAPSFENKNDKENFYQLRERLSNFIQTQCIE